MLDKSYVVHLTDGKANVVGLPEFKDSPEEAQNLIEVHNEATGGGGYFETIGECVCGESVLLQDSVIPVAWDIACHGCHRQYNTLGQELRRPRYSDYEIEMGLDN